MSRFYTECIQNTQTLAATKAFHGDFKLSCHAESFCFLPDAFSSDIDTGTIFIFVSGIVRFISRVIPYKFHLAGSGLNPLQPLGAVLTVALYWFTDFGRWAGDRLNAGELTGIVALTAWKAFIVHLHRFVYAQLDACFSNAFVCTWLCSSGSDSNAHR
jgi:hypothetical protein